jgi:hypothetical protein
MLVVTINICVLGLCFVNHTRNIEEYSISRLGKNGIVCIISLLLVMLRSETSCCMNRYYMMARLGGPLQGPVKIREL